MNYGYFSENASEQALFSDSAGADCSRLSVGEDAATPLTPYVAWEQHLPGSLSYQRMRGGSHSLLLRTKHTCSQALEDGQNEYLYQKAFMLAIVNSYCHRWSGVSGLDL